MTAQTPVRTAYGARSVADQSDWSATGPVCLGQRTERNVRVQEVVAKCSASATYDTVTR